MEEKASSGLLRRTYLLEGGKERKRDSVHGQDGNLPGEIVVADAAAGQSKNVTGDAGGEIEG